MHASFAELDCLLCIIHCCHEQVQQRRPIFDQMIVNGYQPGEGIKAHVDLLKFDDGIAIISLAAPAVMTFTQVTAETAGSLPAGSQNPQPSASIIEGSAIPILPTDSVCKLPLTSATATESSMSQGACTVDILLEPGHLLLLHGEARFGWKHGIQTHKPDVMQQCNSACRTSITFRKLIAT